MLVYAAGLTQTSQDTLDAKARLFIGSDVSALSIDPLRRTPATDAVGTVVIRYLYGRTPEQNDDIQVLAIDPDTFAGTAFWDRRFADESLDELLAGLRAPLAGGRVPAVVVPDGPDFPATFDVRLGRTTARLETSARAELLPGPPAAGADGDRGPVPARRRGPVRRHDQRAVVAWATWTPRGRRSSASRRGSSRSAPGRPSTGSPTSWACRGRSAT